MAPNTAKYGEYVSGMGQNDSKGLSMVTARISIVFLSFAHFQ